jgi:hypothetical protein
LRERTASPKSEREQAKAAHDQARAQCATAAKIDSGLPTVVGDDHELDVELEGTCAGKFATYAGTADQFPGVILEGMLLFSEQQQPRAAQARKPIRKFAPARLPKLPKRSR